MKQKTIDTMERIIRTARQKVFDIDGERYTEQIKRIKNSKPYKQYMLERAYAASVRAGERLTGMGY